MGLSSGPVSSAPVSAVPTLKPAAPAGNPWYYYAQQRGA